MTRFQSTVAALSILTFPLVGCQAAVAPGAAPVLVAAAPSEQERNKAAVRRWYEEGDNKGNPAIADEIFAADVVMHHPTSPEPIIGTAPIKAGSAGLHQAFPGFVGKVVELLAEGDRVTARWSLEGAQKGAFMGIPPTNKPFKLEGITVYRFAGGKIAEGWYAADMYSFFSQIGALPPGSPPAAAPAP